MKKKLIKVDKGNVKSVSVDGVTYRYYYSKGDAIRADWYDELKESVQVYLKSGKILIINNCGNIIGHA